MGNFYASITVRGVAPAQVVDALRELRRTAYISPIIRGCVVVYDRDAFTSDAAAPHLGSALSHKLRTTTLLAMNADDDALVLKAFRDGEEWATYDSTTPQRHGAAALCRVLGRRWMQPVLWMVLQAPVFPVEFLRHVLAMRVLGLPSMEAMVGYDSIDEGEVLGVATREQCTHVSPHRETPA